MKRLLTSVSLVAALAVAACVSVITEPASVETITSLPRPLSTSESKLISATNDFSFSLFKRLSVAQPGVNVFASPLSASMALGMAMNGASGTTYDQMRSALGFNLVSDAEINGSYKSLIALLRSLDHTTDIRVANSIWYDKTFQVKQSFLDVSKNSFDADVSVLDFRSASAPGTINSWVNGATGGTIPKIIDQIKNDDVMFLINAIYFKAQWRQKFDPAQTTDATFHGVAGDQPMRLMHRNGDMRAVVRSDLAAAELFYGDSAFSMVVVVPQGARTVDALAASLDGSSWSALLNEMHTFKADVYLPRLKLEWERKLNDDLMAMGMRDAFSDGIADFTRLSTQSVVISEVKQKAFVEIDEEGTTAAAVTSVGITAVSLPPQIRADRPFIFAIRERLTGTIIFMGKIVKMP